MGGGGASGDVQFPDYMMDVHGDMIAGSVTDDVGDFSESFTRLDTNLVKLLNIAANTNPWDGFTLTNPSADMAAIDTQLDLYYNAVTSYDDDNISSYVTNALKAVSDVSTADIPEVAASISGNTVTDAQTLFDAHVDTMVAKLPSVVQAVSATTSSRESIENLITSATSQAKASANFSAATTAWKALIGAITTTLSDCNLPKEVNLQSVLVKAAQDADNNLRAAIEVTKRYINGDLLNELVDQFAKRRRRGFNSRLTSFAGQMSDLNAVNSSAFMFGVSNLQAEEMREIADFDANLNMEMLQQGLQAYVQMHSNSLGVGASVEEANSRHHTAIVNASLELMGTLQDRGEIKPTDLIGAYTNLFQSEAGNSISAVDSLMRHMGFIRQDNLEDTTERDIRSAELEVQIENINKQAKEQRYARGLQMISNILQNRVEFEHAAAALELSYRDEKTNIVNTYEEKQAAWDEHRALWELDTYKKGAEILAAPSGAAGTVPNRPGIGREAASIGLQTAGNILSKAGPAAAGAAAAG